MRVRGENGTEEEASSAFSPYRPISHIVPGTLYVLDIATPRRGAFIAAALGREVLNRNLARGDNKVLAEFDTFGSFESAPPIQRKPH